MRPYLLYMITIMIILTSVLAVREINHYENNVEAELCRVLEEYCS